MSSISAIPLHAELNIAVITTTPGARNAMYECPSNPGISITRLNEQLKMIIEFTREGREIQERHAEWLRDRLAERRSRTA